MEFIDKVLGITEIKEKAAAINNTNTELIGKISEIESDNQKMASILGTIGYGYEFITGETNIGDLPQVKEVIILYEQLRLRSWQFILNNHIANLIVTKRINWQIGSGLLFNSKPSEKPFIDFYGKEKGKLKHKEFTTNIEYQYRNLIKSKDVDYTKENNLHEMARIIDYNAAGDGDVLLLMRIKNGLPNIQIISGQAVCSPLMTDQVKSGDTENEGVEKNAKGEVVAYHVLIDSNMSNSETLPVGDVPKYGTKRIPVYSKNGKFKQAWLYRTSDLKKLGETRSMPLLSMLFEVLQHINDYIIANAKNAQLKAQLVIAFEKDANSDGSKVFDSGINVPGMPTTSNSNENDTTDILRSRQDALKLERDLRGNAIVADLQKGVKAEVINETAQSDQGEYLKSTLETAFANAGFPLEFMLSSYNSNYTASMGARSDTQHNLDVTNEIIPSAQLYKMHYNMTLRLLVLTGKIECEPLRKAYLSNDIVVIQAISNSTFEGTKLKPIDPLKFIKSLRAQLPESIREQVSLNTFDNIINMASGGDYESITNQVVNEILAFPDELKTPKPEPVVTQTKVTK